MREFVPEVLGILFIPLHQLSSCLICLKNFFSVSVTCVVIKPAHISIITRK